MIGTRIARTLGALAGLVAGGEAQAQAQPRTVSPSAAPAAWLRYAEEATQTITGWIGEPDGPGARFHAYFDQTRPAADRPSAPLTVAVWVKPDGTIERIDFAPFVHEAANSDLRAALVGRRLAAPPPDMLLPMRIAVQLMPAPAGH
jgi:hypothetical protein